MTKKQFLKDVKILYEYLDIRKNKMNMLYTYLEKGDFAKLTIIEQFALALDIEVLDNEIRLALIQRLISLRDDNLIQILKANQIKEKALNKKIKIAYNFTKTYWIEEHEKTIQYIINNNLFTKFYQEIFNGIFKVGIQMSKWQVTWNDYIINNINKTLITKFKNDALVMEFLEKENLFDIGHDSLIADRCYSALSKDNNNNFKSLAYIDVFKNDVYLVINELDELLNKLVELEDDIYNLKWKHIEYFQAIITALSETRCEKLVHYWSQIDKAWMELTSPIQIGHPLEFYEDHYRKAVALEWDIRISNPDANDSSSIQTNIKKMANEIFHQIPNNDKYKKIFDFSNSSVNKVQFYPGRPAMFFAAQFNGLFSAQVVPNDEKISQEYGKKIFAFSDEILQAQKAKPFLQISKDFFGQDFLNYYRNILFRDKKMWHLIYDITTVGHEYGHILWCDKETQTIMNKTSNYKNIEEFKATSGGLVSFFMNSEDEIIQYNVLLDTIKRSIELIAWMENDTAQPYYCESLIHLKGMFESGILIWQDNKLSINTNNDNIKKIISWYYNTYKQLVLHYLEKKDASLFLNLFMNKEGKYFLPLDTNIRNFVLFYYERYKKIGRQIDTSDKKNNYEI